MQSLSLQDMRSIGGGYLSNAELCGLSLGLTWAMMVFEGPLIVVHAGFSVIICSMA